MATDEAPPAPSTRAQVPEGGIEIAPLYMEHWLIFTASKSREHWWVWCPVRMTGGIDTARIRWSRPMGELVEPADEPERGAGPGFPSQSRAWSYSEAPLASFDLPWLPPEEA